MSPNILLIVRKHLESNLKINSARVDKFIEVMKQWNKGKVIYPNMIKSQLLISFSEAYRILDSLEELNILSYAFQVYCHKCNKYQERTIMDSLNEFVDDSYCDNNHKLSSGKDVVVLYKVSIDE